MIAPNLTFSYQFMAEGTQPPQREGSIDSRCWAGHGKGGEGLVGTDPKFDLAAGWLTLFPTGGWTQSFPTRWFSDVERPPQGPDSAAQVAAIKAVGTEWLEAQKEAQKEAAARSVPGDFASYTKATNEAMADALRRRGLTRDLVSYSVFVGEALGSVLRVGDEFAFSRNPNGDFHYSLGRGSETILSAGSVGGCDSGGPMAVWQDYDRHPIRKDKIEEMKKKFVSMRSVGNPSTTIGVAEWFDVHKPYVTVRIHDQVFHLLDREDAKLDPYYVFLARSNKNLPPIAFEFAPRAVYSAGRVDEIGSKLICDAADRLISPKIRML